MKKAVILFVVFLFSACTVGNALAQDAAGSEAAPSRPASQLVTGQQNQPGSSLLINEARAGAIAGSADGSEPAVLTLELPPGLFWADRPDIKVTSGDLELGTPFREGGTLSIPVVASSSEAAVIEISNITYTADRTVPEGNIEVIVGGNALVQTDFSNRNFIVREVAAVCVTPAPGDTMGGGEFRIGSSIYYTGGMGKMMDAAPYVKGLRTYVPLRCLGEILGAEVVWDEAARTVALSKGGTMAVFAVGSTTYTVNGESRTADAVPEITNGRTMLPVRWGAEAFGAQVGWDAAARTVRVLP